MTYQPPRTGPASSCGCGRDLLSDQERETGRCDSCAGRSITARYAEDYRRRAHTGHLDPLVARYLYAMRDLGVTTQAAALRVLDAIDGGELSRAQRAELLVEIVPPGV